MGETDAPYLGDGTSVVLNDPNAFYPWGLVDTAATEEAAEKEATLLNDAWRRGYQAALRDHASCLGAAT